MIKMKDLIKKQNDMIRKESGMKINEDQYGSSDAFIPLKVDKYAPNTRIGLGDTIKSLEGAAFGFHLSEDSEMDHPYAAEEAHNAYNKWAKGMGTKLQKLYKELNKGWKIYDDSFSKARKKGGR
jgi:hypothetical protein